MPEFNNNRKNAKLNQITPETNFNIVVTTPKEMQNFQDTTKNYFQTSKIVWNDEDRLSMIGNIMQAYPQIKKQAEEIVINEEYEKTEIEMAQSFNRLKPDVRNQLQERIPILVLYRLLKRIKEL